MGAYHSKGGITVLNNVVADDDDELGDDDVFTDSVVATPIKCASTSFLNGLYSSMRKSSGRYKRTSSENNSEDSDLTKYNDILHPKSLSENNLTRRREDSECTTQTDINTSLVCGAGRSRQTTYDVSKGIIEGGHSSRETGKIKKTKNRYKNFRRKFKRKEKNKRQRKVLSDKEKDINNNQKLAQTLNQSRALTHALNQNLFLPCYPVDYDKASNFEVVRRIGCGTFSQVYKVKCLKSGECFALKKIKKSNVIKQKICFQVQEEIDISMRLKNHPFILGIVTSWQIKSYLLQLLPYVAYGDLYRLWTRVRTFPLACVAQVGAEIATALTYIHKNNIIYRDVKMDNILISHSGHTLLSDFGLSKNMGKLRRTHSICGTLDYAAPEVLSGNNGYSYQCDWWSLGIVLVTMATGQFPFKSTDDYQTRCQTIKQGMGQLSKLTDNEVIKEVINKLICYQSSERAGSIQELQKMRLFSRVNFNSLPIASDGPLKKFFITYDIIYDNL